VAKRRGRIRTRLNSAANICTAADAQIFKPSVKPSEVLERVPVRFRYEFLLFLFGGVRGWSLRGFCARAGADAKETGSDGLQVPAEEVWECIHHPVWVAHTYGREFRALCCTVLYNSTRHSKCD
jgi:hypothetical protein